MSIYATYTVRRYVDPKHDTPFVCYCEPITHCTCDRADAGIVQTVYRPSTHTYNPDGTYNFCGDVVYCQTCIVALPF